MRYATTIDVIRDFDDAPDALLISIDELCVLAGRSRPTIYRDAKSGNLRLTKVGRSTRISAGEARRYLGIAA